MSDDLEHQLDSFGRTLESAAGEPVRSGEPAALPHRPPASRRRWALVGAAACVLAVVGGLAAVTRRNDGAQIAQPDPASSISLDGSQGAAAGGGLGAFEPLVGVGAVVEATVVDIRGPRAVPAPGGGIDHPDYSDDASEWTTPFGLPVLVVDDIELVASIGGSERADAVASSVRQAFEAGADIEVSVPVGVYEEGERYELWLGPQQDVGHLAYLAFDESGDAIEGLLIPDADAAYRRLSEHTGDGRVMSLVAMARELNEAWDGGGQGELMDFVYGPEQATSEELPGDFSAGTSEGSADDDGQVELDVSVIGAEPGAVYGLRGSQILGWFVAGGDGHLALRGLVPPDEELQLVTEQAPGGSVGVVAGVPPLLVDADGDPFRAFADLDTDPAVWRTGLTQAELDVLVRSGPALHTEAVPNDPLGLERDGWALVQRTTEPFEAGGIPCPAANGLAELDGVAQTHDILGPPDGTGVDLDVQVIDVGSIDRGNDLASGVLAIGDCLAEADGVEVETGAMSSIRASWFRTGPDFVLATIVGEGSWSIVLEIEGAPFDDDLVGDLAHRADEFLRRAPRSP